MGNKNSKKSVGKGNQDSLLRNKKPKSTSKGKKTHLSKPIILTSSVFPPENAPQYESPLPSRDCWIEIIVYLQMGDILNLCLTHKFLGQLLYDEYFFQRLCAPNVKADTVSWKEFFANFDYVEFPRELLTASKKELKEITVEGLLHRLQRRTPHPGENLVKSRKVAIYSDNNWYSITKQLSEDDYLLYVGVNPIQFPDEADTGYTLCSDTYRPLIYDFGKGTTLDPTWIVWYCDFDPETWFKGPSLQINYLDPDTHSEKNAIKARHQTSSRFVRIFECLPNISTQYLSFRNAGSQTLISGLEIFGKMSTKGKKAIFEFSSDTRISTSGKSCYIEKKGFPLYNDQELYDSILEKIILTNSQRLSISSEEESSTE